MSRGSPWCLLFSGHLKKFTVTVTVTVSVIVTVTVNVTVIYRHSYLQQYLVLPAHLHSLHVPQETGAQMAAENCDATCCTCEIATNRDSDSNQNFAHEF
jgi:hypothetical protein